MGEAGQFGEVELVLGVAVLWGSFDCWRMLCGASLCVVRWIVAVYSVFRLQTSR